MFIFVIFLYISSISSYNFADAHEKCASSHNVSTTLSRSKRDLMTCCTECKDIPTGYSAKIWHYYIEKEYYACCHCWVTCQSCPCCSPCKMCDKLDRMLRDPKRMLVYLVKNRARFDPASALRPFANIMQGLPFLGGGRGGGGGLLGGLMGGGRGGPLGGLGGLLGGAGRGGGLLGGLGGLGGLFG